jgi:hypothetical protein
MGHLVFLFGEAERGHFCAPVACRSLVELSETFGNPPEESQGLFYAIQALLFNRRLIYFRVKEEGFSIPDYMRGLHLLRAREMPEFPAAICMPGVGDAHLIEMCFLFHSIMITTEKYLYDYLTS